MEWNVKRAETEIGGFSNPAKMPCKSWSTPASKCILGAKLQQVKGSTCSGCYAMKGCYTFKSTVNATQRRFERITEALNDSKSAERFISAFAFALNFRSKRTPYFRWHDAGDLQSAEHLRIICAIAARTPGVAHWLPTREAGIVREFLNHGGYIPHNMVVRLSTPMVDGVPTGILQGLAISHPRVALSGVHSPEENPAFGESCIAYTQDGECRDCRACWDPQRDISYPKH